MFSYWWLILIAIAGLLAAKKFGGETGDKIGNWGLIVLGIGSSYQYSLT